MAHKKGLGSSRNGRESNPKMLGVKVFKYKAKKGYRRRAGHRSELTRLEVTELKAGGGKAKAKPKAKAEKEEAGDGS